ncbi:MAG TPA: RluA family pseudouridine synthase [Candidatus Binataceae bacterium]|nr:RluA family pseudouridine synthase [Candidatus Binataceae bacterium]
MAERERLDRYLVRSGAVASRRAADELIASGGVTINGRRPRKSDLVSSNDTIEVAAPERLDPIVAEPLLAVEVLYEDAATIVVNKRGGIPCHPLKAGEVGTVMNAVVACYPETAAAGPKPLEGGLVHRLDNGTSGALIIARNREAYAILHNAIRSGAVAREYLALVAGNVARAMMLDAPIAHHAKNARKMMLGAEGSSRKRAGRAAYSAVEPKRRVGEFTLVTIAPRTGSRHQIRVHLANAGYPIIGDTLYGGPPHDALAPGRFWLHLTRISFESAAGVRVSVEAPLPADLKSLLR